MQFSPWRRQGKKKTKKEVAEGWHRNRFSAKINQGVREPETEVS